MITSDDLKKIPLFEQLPVASREALAKLFTVRSLPTGETLFREGDKTKSLYWVGVGAVRFSRRSKRGPEENILLGPGSLIGEYAWLDPGLRSVDATAAEPLTVAELSYEAFDTFLKGAPDRSAVFHRALARVLWAKLRQLPDEEAGFRGIKARCQ